MPAGHARRDWAVGMKFVVDLPEDTPLQPGTVLHTFGFPEPEIFGFLYVHPDRVASRGHLRAVAGSSRRSAPATATSSTTCSTRTSGAASKDARLRSWGAKSILESGPARRALPRGRRLRPHRRGLRLDQRAHLLGRGRGLHHRVQLAEGVIELLEAASRSRARTSRRPTCARRRASWVESEGQVAERARDGFQRGVVDRPPRHGALRAHRRAARARRGAPAPGRQSATLEGFYAGRSPPTSSRRSARDCAAKGLPLHDALMDRAGWPAVPLDGKLLVSHQDALLMGGKVQAPAGYADHVVFLAPELCRACSRGSASRSARPRRCGRATAARPTFDREKCVHCGACLWSCPERIDGHGPGEPTVPRRRGRAALGGELGWRTDSRSWCSGASCPTRCRPSSRWRRRRGRGSRTSRCCRRCSTRGPPRALRGGQPRREGAGLEGHARLARAEGEAPADR